MVVLKMPADSSQFSCFTISADDNKPEEPSENVLANSQSDSDEYVFVKSARNGNLNPRWIVLPGIDVHRVHLLKPKPPG